MRFLGELDFGWGWVFFLAEARALDMRASKAEGREEDIEEIGFRESVWVLRNDGDLKKGREGMRGERSLERRVKQMLGIETHGRSLSINWRRVGRWRGTRSFLFYLERGRAVRKLVEGGEMAGVVGV